MMQGGARLRDPPPPPQAPPRGAEPRPTQQRDALGGSKTERNPAMNIRRMGRTGLKVSELCLGTMTFGHQCDERASFAILDRAADAGVDFIDTADAYPVPPTPETAGRTEEIIGKWLAGKRDRFVLATKCRIRVGHGANDEGLSRRHICKAVEDSLRRLRTDRIDLYQAHAPDADTPLDETL